MNNPSSVTDIGGERTDIKCLDRKKCHDRETKNVLARTQKVAKFEKKQALKSVKFGVRG